MIIYTNRRKHEMRLSYTGRKKTDVKKSNSNLFEPAKKLMRGKAYTMHVQILYYKISLVASHTIGT